MGHCLSFVLGILKGKIVIELLSKLNWWLFRDDWEPNYEVIIEILFWIISICFNANWCPSSSVKVMSCFHFFGSLKNQWKKGSHFILIHIFFILFFYKNKYVNLII